MGFFSRPYTQLSLLVAAITAAILFVQFRFYYDGRGIIDFILKGHEQDSLPALGAPVLRNEVRFPVNFTKHHGDILEYAHKHFNSDEFKYSSFVEVQPSAGYHPDLSGFKKHSINVFHDVENAEDDQKCDKSHMVKDIEVGSTVELKVALREVLYRFLNEFENNPYYDEVSPFFMEQLADQLRLNLFDNSWFRLAGSSVWLEQYGVHLMISRVIYTPKQVRTQPSLLLTYAQLFTKDWKELVDTRLVVPTNDPENPYGDSEDKYRVMKFPCFLEIPFWHDYSDTNLKYYGPEDPRITLVKNKKGFEEPMIIFNAYQRKLLKDEKTGEVKPAFFRSMFMCLPWQRQKGKVNVDGDENGEYKNRIYSKVTELRIINQKKREIQKNWTPFVSYTKRAEKGYDETVDFVYSWSNLEVLRCGLTQNPGECKRVFRAKSDNAPVGPLRGGTELVSLNELLSRQSKVSLEKIIPKGREIWMGLARTHLNGCGCGAAFYRPNLVILVKDDPADVPGSKDSNFALMEDFFKVSHISSSISFNVPIVGWEINKPQDLCSGSNVFIPNGISSWWIKDIKEEAGSFKTDDFMTFSLSLADYTVHNVDVKGLLNAILQLDDKTLFNSVEKLNEAQGSQAKIIPPSRFYHTNVNIQCAIDKSMDFCKDYSSKVKSDI